jgi:transposase
MRPKSSSAKKPAEQVVKDIRRATRRHFSAEDKIRIVLEGLRGGDGAAHKFPAISGLAFPRGIG